MNTSICPKCKKEFTPFGFFVVDKTFCYDCKWKEEFWTGFVVIVVVLVIILGLRLTWAKLVYNDMRCFWAECRIIK